jgi:xanthine dehydrogenase accessory factor
MLENVYSIASRWLGSGRRVVAATLVRSEGSSPLEPGATMLVDDGGRVEGSVTGGCVEGALFEEAQRVLEGAPPSLRTYGFSDEAAAGVGLMCGGTVHVFVHELDPELGHALGELAAAVKFGTAAAVAVLLDGEGAGRMMVEVGGEVHGSLAVSQRLDRAVRRDLDGLLTQGVSRVRRYGVGGETMGAEIAAYIRTFSLPPRLIVFGAIDFSAAVAVLGKQLGFHVTICDARQPFVTAARFQVADEIAVDWPDRFLGEHSLDERDVVLVFTHDPKFDEPALIAALASDAGYIGALGSVRTHDDRLRRLRAAGVDEASLERIASPCGLDIGARTPEETAVSILAEVIARRNGRAGGPLSGTRDWIHPREDLASA